MYVRGCVSLFTYQIMNDCYFSVFKYCWNAWSRLLNFTRSRAPTPETVVDGPAVLKSMERTGWQYKQSAVACGSYN